MPCASGPMAQSYACSNRSINMRAKASQRPSVPPAAPSHGEKQLGGESPGPVVVAGHDDRHARGNPAETRADGRRRRDSVAHAVTITLDLRSAA